MKQYLIVFYLLSGFTFSTPSFAQQDTNTTPQDFYWKKAKIAKVKAFLYFSEFSTPLGGQLILNKKKQLSKDILPKYTQTLTKEQTNLLVQKLATYTPNDSLIEMSLCFNPHHALVFYNNKGKILGHLSICFACDRYELNPEHPNNKPFTMTALKRLMQQLKMPLFDEYEVMEKFLKKEGLLSKVKTFEKVPPHPNKEKKQN
ncbi:hypothetical protein BKI52_35060 [marine bacterium AO1-C]|nr:hypothetical protein BKI52_35060 [marine bacterium AO1-C]